MDSALLVQCRDGFGADALPTRGVDAFNDDLARQQAEYDTMMAGIQRSQQEVLDAYLQARERDNAVAPSPTENPISMILGHVGSAISGNAARNRAVLAPTYSAPPIAAYPTTVRGAPSVDVLRPGTTSTRIGAHTFYSDGTTATQIGDTAHMSDGTTYTRMGNSVLGSDGTSATKIGSTTFQSDGTTATQIGTGTFLSNGTVCQKIGNSEFCN